MLLPSLTAAIRSVIHPILYTLPFTHWTPQPTSCTLHPTPCTLHPAPCTLHPAPCTLHPSPSWRARNLLSLSRTRNVNIKLSGKGNSTSHGARPVHFIISLIKWIRTSSLSIKNSLSQGEADQGEAKAALVWVLGEFGEGDACVVEAP